MTWSRFSDIFNIKQYFYLLQIRRETSTLRHFQSIELAMEPVPLQRYGTHVRVQNVTDFRRFSSGNLGATFTRHT